MPRAIWNGSISLGLVNIPISIYVASRDRTIAFHNLHESCHTPLESKRWCPYHNEEVPWGEVVKGYKVSRNKYVVLTKKEIESVQIKSTKAIDIIMFIDAGQIDPLLVEKNYYAVPQEGGERAYALFRDVLQTTGKAALGKLVLRSKEHLVAVRHYRGGLVVTILHYSDEISPFEGLESVKDIEPKQNELNLAKILVDSLSGDFDIDQYKDEYNAALSRIIKKKLEGKPIEIRPIDVRPTPSKELLESLKASVRTVRKKKD